MSILGSTRHKTFLEYPMIDRLVHLNLWVRWARACLNAVISIGYGLEFRFTDIWSVDWRIWEGRAQCYWGFNWQMKAYFRNFIWFSRNSNFKKWFRANFSTPHRQTNNRMPIICHQIINHLRRNKASSTRKLLATRSVSLRPKKNLIIDVIYFSAMNLNRDISKFVALRYIISGNWFFMVSGEYAWIFSDHDVPPWNFSFG